MIDQEVEKQSLLPLLLLEHSQMVTRTAFYYVQDQMIAEDLAQEVFLRAYLHLESYRQEAKLSTWLYRITVNVCKDYLKSWKHRMHRTTQFIRNASHQPSAESEVMEKLNRDELTKQVLGLPLRYREVILLHYYEHLSSREIAELLQENESTVRTKIQRGLGKLRTSLGEEMPTWSL